MNKKHELTGFHEFDRSSGRVSEKAIVTLTALRLIGFNKKIVQEYLRPDEKFAKLYFNPDKKLIAIKLLTQEGAKNDDNAYQLHKGTRSDYTSITSWAFFDHWKIDHSITRQYEADLDSEGRMIFVDLKNPIREGTRTSPKGRRREDKK